MAVFTFIPKGGVTSRQSEFIKLCHESRETLHPGTRILICSDLPKYSNPLTKLKFYYIN